MRSLYDSNLLLEFQSNQIFFDTNVFIGAFSFPELFKDFFDGLKQVKCEFVTIPPVVFEFTRGTHDVESFSDREEFLRKLTTVYPIEEDGTDLREFTIVLQKIKGDIHFTDFLLIACLYKFPSSYLLSANHKDCPIEILDRKGIITIDTDREIRNYGIYQFSQKKFNKAAESILEAK